MSERRDARLLGVRARRGGDTCPGCAYASRRAACNRTAERHAGIAERSVNRNQGVAVITVIRVDQGLLLELLLSGGSSRELDSELVFCHSDGKPFTQDARVKRIRASNMRLERESADPTASRRSPYCHR